VLILNTAWSCLILIGGLWGATALTPNAANHQLRNLGIILDLFPFCGAI